MCFRTLPIAASKRELADLDVTPRYGFRHWREEFAGQRKRVGKPFARPIVAAVNDVEARETWLGGERRSVDLQHFVVNAGGLFVFAEFEQRIAEDFQRNGFAWHQFTQRNRTLRVPPQTMPGKFRARARHKSTRVLLGRNGAQ